MSNYPPGVTGNEPQIRGLGERTTHKVCVNSDGFTATLMTTDLKDSIVRLAELLKHDVTIASLKSAANSVVFFASVYEPQMDIDDCPFEGEVDTQIDQWIEFWDCPVCGKEHQEDLEMPEPDYEKDADIREDHEMMRAEWESNHPESES
jgi:hypothetical protein